jgi:hypothetical protein
MAATMKITVFWYAWSYGLVNNYHRFGGTVDSIFRAEDTLALKVEVKFPLKY